MKFIFLHIKLYFNNDNENNSVDSYHNFELIFSYSLSLMLIAIIILNLLSLSLETRMN